mgnify:CR=1 FL=1
MMKLIAGAALAVLVLAGVACEGVEPLPEDEGGGFVIRFPDLPGCLSDGATYEETIANGRDEGFTKLLFDPETHLIIGGGIVGTHAGDLIGEICLAIEMGAEATDIGKTIHPHPTLGESIGMAAEVFEGVCTDLPPQKKPAPAAT